MAPRSHAMLQAHASIHTCARFLGCRCLVGCPPAPLSLSPCCPPPATCREEVAVAWAHHTNLGDFTTAALMWLERCGQGE
jgi:hypothetical protein